MAEALLEQLELLRGAAVDGLRAGAPASSHGPWPEPHDPIFDFTITAQAFAWLDELGRRAAAVLQQARPADPIAHGDYDQASHLAAQVLSVVVVDGQRSYVGVATEASRSPDVTLRESSAKLLADDLAAVQNESERGLQVGRDRLDAVSLGRLG